MKLGQGLKDIYDAQLTVLDLLERAAAVLMMAIIDDDRWSARSLLAGRLTRVAVTVAATGAA